MANYRSAVTCKGKYRLIFIGRGKYERVKEPGMEERGRSSKKLYCPSSASCNNLKHQFASMDSNMLAKYPGFALDAMLNIFADTQIGTKLA